VLRSLLAAGLTICQLAVVVALRTLNACAAQDASPALQQRLDTTQRVELISGESVSVNDSNLVFIFTSGPTSYLTLKPEFLNLLGSDPKIEVPKGLTVRLVAFAVQPVSVETAGGVGTGYQLKNKLELSTQKDLPSGDYPVIIRFDAVSAIAKNIQATSPNVGPTLRFNVRVFTSANERESLRAAERQAHELEEAKRATTERRQQIRTGLIVIVTISGVFIIIHSLAWIFPSHRITISKSKSASTTGSISKTMSVQTRPQAEVEHSIARTFLGRRTDIKIEAIEIPVDESGWETWKTTTTSDSGTSVSYELRVKYDVRLTASTGPDTEPGWYLARTPIGRVRIHCAG